MKNLIFPKPFKPNMDISPLSISPLPEMPLTYLRMGEDGDLFASLDECSKDHEIFWQYFKARYDDAFPGYVNFYYDRKNGRFSSVYAYCTRFGPLIAVGREYTRRNNCDHYYVLDETDLLQTEFQRISIDSDRDLVLSSAWALRRYLTKSNEKNTDRSTLSKIIDPLLY